MFSIQYYEAVKGALEAIGAQEGEKIKKAGACVADTVQGDGLVHFFGCGHSHLIGSELFFRAGGLVPVNPMFEESVMLHAGAVKSSQIERMSGYAKLVIEGYTITPGDTLVVSSSSGINSFPIEMAREAKSRGAAVIAITSAAYKAEKSRDPSGKRLMDACDFYIDNHVPHGDAAVDIGDGVKAGPLSSICGIFIANSIMLEACEALRRRGVRPPVFMSGNIEGGDEYNAEMIAKYRKRIKHL